MPRRTTAALALTNLLFLLTFPAGPAWAGSSGACEDGSAHAFLRLTTADTPWDGCTVVMPNIINTVQIWANHVPAKRIRFSIQQPSFGNIVAETYNFPHTGTLATGIDLDLGGCQPTGDTLLGTLTVLLPTGTVGGCVPWQVDFGCEIVDCDDVIRPASPRHHQFGVAEGCCFYIDCPSLPPTNPFPGDGAIEVPLDVTMLWGAPPFYALLRISTEPACYTGQSFDLFGTNTFSPDFLQPNTTYYWQVSWSDGLECGATSAVFSFKTISRVPADQETWGRIKAFYR